MRDSSRNVAYLEQQPKQIRRVSKTEVTKAKN